MVDDIPRHLIPTDPPSDIPHEVPPVGANGRRLLALHWEDSILRGIAGNAAVASWRDQNSLKGSVINALIELLKPLFLKDKDASSYRRPQTPVSRLHRKLMGHLSATLIANLTRLEKALVTAENQAPKEFVQKLATVREGLEQIAVESLVVCDVEEIKALRSRVLEVLVTTVNVRRKWIREAPGELSQYANLPCPMRLVTTRKGIVSWSRLCQGIHLPDSLVLAVVRGCESPTADNLLILSEQSDQPLLQQAWWTVRPDRLFIRLACQVLRSHAGVAHTHSGEETAILYESVGSCLATYLLAKRLCLILGQCCWAPPARDRVFQLLLPWLTDGLEAKELSAQSDISSILLSVVDESPFGKSPKNIKELTEQALRVFIEALGDAQPVPSNGPEVSVDFSAAGSAVSADLTRLDVTSPLPELARHSDSSALSLRTQIAVACRGKGFPCPAAETAPAEAILSLLAQHRSRADSDALKWHRVVEVMRKQVLPARFSTARQSPSTSPIFLDTITLLGSPEVLGLLSHYIVDSALVPSATLILDEPASSTQTLAGLLVLGCAAPALLIDGSELSVSLLKKVAAPSAKTPPSTPVASTVTTAAVTFDLLCSALWGRHSKASLENLFQSSPTKTRWMWILMSLRRMNDSEGPFEVLQEVLNIVSELFNAIFDAKVVKQELAKLHQLLSTLGTRYEEASQDDLDKVDRLSGLAVADRGLMLGDRLGSDIDRLNCVDRRYRIGISLTVCRCLIQRVVDLCFEKERIQPDFGAGACLLMEFRNTARLTHGNGDPLMARIVKRYSAKSRTAVKELCTRWLSEHLAGDCRWTFKRLSALSQLEQLALDDEFSSAQEKAKLQNWLKPRKLKLPQTTLESEEGFLRVLGRKDSHLTPLLLQSDPLD